ncbi:dihydroorotate oxidase [Candidatus Kinetoplastibacterium desouzaii TCC079E]|uniref:Dihydroorotate dehydrogenase (quinone) n=1 Tax=Candidatus Kinetoplastidibacterium desouzai TCC079E TaxID=1208919 RepID=M1LMY3_9PROT|nr:quinone-dependent dihydroorotate dehydrogenase [Candidatus Kinetoplastibacterium desouzaii]AGF47082.1 dihydroorotate oxidase [Candidatus Kinetoplastibacterium desouzaii TCC079E]
MSIIFNTYPLVKKILFQFNPETAHHITLFSLKQLYKYRFTRKLTHYSAYLPTKIMGLDIANPIGLAAGLDKNGICIDPLGNLGFGFIEIGTVTPYPQAGNKKPRLFRIPEKEALINRMGFNNLGISEVIKNIEKSTWQKTNGVLGVNIGKNLDTSIDDAISDYNICLEHVYNYADYITINISSPNTKNLRSLQNKEHLDLFLRKIKEKHLQLADLNAKYVPIALKISPDLTTEEINTICDFILKNKIDGIIATNTTISRDMIKNLKISKENGGLSGSPLHELSLQVIKKLKSLVGNEITIIGSGGIITPAQARETMLAGANALQLYTGLIYKGPNIIKECIKTINSVTS